MIMLITYGKRFILLCVLLRLYVLGLILFLQVKLQLNMRLVVNLSLRTALTVLHSQWYRLDKENNKFIKIVPLNIVDLLTPIGIAHWIMGDGYWDNSSKTGVICTDNLTFSEVELLIRVLKSKFNLTATVRSSEALRRTK
uniref:LAGLIDADG homing endonuclease n=1 Tax=Phanerochaete carnosa TaxID=231932 RepID=A0A895KWR6_9APHY|nr:LAGLIDADG homing endonuclease [Phanerochaete carnosa]QRZ60378.1 LAGLIDADG homing endonuclease [Phanerochaete carnosa]